MNRNKNVQFAALVVFSGIKKLRGCIFFSTFHLVLLVFFSFQEFNSMSVIQLQRQNCH